MNERAVILNKLAQGLSPLAEGIGWFEGQSETEQLVVLRNLASFCVQAGAISEDGPESIRRADIRPTHTPAVLITREPLTHQLAKIVNLPAAERIKSFRLLVALLSIADERRRRLSCADECTHAWHHLETAGHIRGA